MDLKLIAFGVYIFVSRILLCMQCISLRRLAGSCVLTASMINCPSMPSIDTLDWPLDQHLIDILIDTQLTLDRHSINSRSIVGQVSTSSCIVCLDWKSMDYRPRCQWSVDWVSTKVLTECQWSFYWGYRHSTADVFSTHDLTFMRSYITLISLLPGITCWHEHGGQGWVSLQSMTVCTVILNTVEAPSQGSRIILVLT